MVSREGGGGRLIRLVELVLVYFSGFVLRSETASCGEPSSSGWTSLVEPSTYHLRFAPTPFILPRRLA